MTMTTESAARAARHTTGSCRLRVAAATLATGLLALQAGCGDDTSEPSACVDDAARTVSCGADGEQAQVCAGGVWVDDGACVEPEPGDCADGADRVEACGPDDAWLQPRSCSGGRWVDAGACYEPECEAGEQQAAACAEDAERLQLQACGDARLWADDGACFDPECDEGEVRELDCGPDTEQAAPPACVSGLWENGGACVCPEGLVYDELAQSCAREVAGCDPDGAPFGGGDGTAEEPFLICSVAQLHAVRARDGVESHYVLAATLDLSDEEGFAPLGALHGSFDGAGQALVGLTLEASPAAGLFASVGAVGDEGAASGVVRDVVLRGFDVQGGTLAGALAPVVGTSSDNVIERVRLYASEVATAEASEVAATGGLVGHLMAGTVRDGVVDATISGHDEVGGLVGRIVGAGGVVADSSASGTVVGRDRVGGLVGFVEGQVPRGLASAAVTGRHSVGGLVGRAEGPVTDGLASGAVEGVVGVGGLVGVGVDDVVTSAAYGDVTGDELVGGLVGIAVARVDDSAAHGRVQGRVVVGGLVGALRWSPSVPNGAVTRCQAWGDVVASGQVAGGLVGETYLPIERSFARGSVSAQDLAGGLVGALLRAAVVGSWCDGAVSGSGGASGLVGGAAVNTTIRHSWTASSVSVGSGGAATLLIRTSDEAVVIDGVVARAQGSLPLVLASSMPDLSDALAVTDDELALPSTFTALGWDFEEVWVMSAEGGVTAPDLRENPRGE